MFTAEKKIRMRKALCVGASVASIWRMNSGSGQSYMDKLKAKNTPLAIQEKLLKEAREQTVPIVQISAEEWMKLTETVRRMEALSAELSAQKAVLSSEANRYTEKMMKAAEAQKEATEKALQMVSLYRNGELVKMSKRTGQSVTLNELIEEVGTDAARFFFAMRSIDSQLDFDLTLATEKSNENPVYYIQYAHARICSIMRQLAEENVVEAAAADYNLLTDATELELIKKLGEYQEMLEVAAEERAVHRVAHYVHDLAGLFHSFYNQCRILGVGPEVQQARIKLVQATRHTIKHALNILGVSAPERM